MSKIRRKSQPDTNGPSVASSAWARLKLPAIIGSVLTTVALTAQFFDAGTKVVDGAYKTREAVRRVIGWTPIADYEIDVRSVTVLPRSLANVMASQEFLHWIWMRAENRRPEPLQLTLQIEISGPAITPGPITAAKYTVDRGKPPVERSVYLPIPFAKSDFKGDEILKVTWTVRDDKDHPLRQNTVDIPVLSREVVPWGLQSAKGEAISRDFLVASLAAWVITPEPAIEQQAREILAKVTAEPDERTRTRRWMQQTYERLFMGPTAVKVQDKAQRFPAKAHEPVRTPAAVLSARRATALEATLLLAAHRMALGRGDLRARLTMLAVPVSDQDPESKEFLLAWSPDGREWEAIDIRRAATTAFEPNRVATTERARQLLKDVDGSTTFKERGVFVDDKQRVVALNFRRAQKFYSIRPLP
jgi:hypothetical protein